MIVDIYNYFKHHPSYNKLIGDDYLFVEYNCPINVEEFELWTESHFITYVINGRKDWIVDSTIYKIKAGDSLFIRKGVYLTKQYLEEEYCVILFFLNDDFIRKFMAEHSSSLNKSDLQRNLGQVLPIHTTETFHSLIGSIFQYLKLEAPIPQSLVEIKFEELLFNIILDPKNKDILEFFTAVGVSNKVNLEDVMMKNFRADLNLVEFAKLCGRSLSSFKRDFYTHFNTTPSKWLKSKRLDYAEMLLLGTNLNINEICYESGFKNNSHFIREFKNKFNLPPGQFKDQSLAT